MTVHPGSTDGSTYSRLKEDGSLDCKARRSKREELPTKISSTCSSAQLAPLPLRCSAQAEFPVPERVDPCECTSFRLPGHSFSAPPPSHSVPGEGAPGVEKDLALAFHISHQRNNTKQRMPCSSSNCCILQSILAVGPACHARSLLSVSVGLSDQWSAGCSISTDCEPERPLSL